MILRIVSARIVGPQTLELGFNDGTSGTADIGSLLRGPIFEPLLDPSYLARMEFDPVCGTVTWPNGADFAPEALRDLVISDSAACKR